MYVEEVATLIYCPVSGKTTMGGNATVLALYSKIAITTAMWQ